MNLYNFYSTPEQLDCYDEADKKVPVVFWKTYRTNPTELNKRERAIAASGKYSYKYAREVLCTSFPLGESAIASSPQHSYYYAYYVIKGPFRLGEPAINSNKYYRTIYQDFLSNLRK